MLESNSNNSWRLIVIIIILMENSIQIPEKKVYHEVSFVSSNKRKIGSVNQIFGGSFRDKFKHPGQFTPTTRDSGIGRSRGISFSGNEITTLYKLRFGQSNTTCNKTSTSICASLEIPPSVLHVNICPENSTQEEEKKQKVMTTPSTEPNLKIDFSKSTGDETPAGQHTMTHAQTFESLASKQKAAGSKTPSTIKHIACGLKETKSPNPLQSKLWSNINFGDVTPFARDENGPLRQFCNHINMSPKGLAAYKEFLFSLFGSICLIRGTQILSQSPRSISSKPFIPKLSHPANVLSNHI